MEQKKIILQKNEIEEIKAMIFRNAHTEARAKFARLLKLNDIERCYKAVLGIETFFCFLQSDAGRVRDVLDKMLFQYITENCINAEEVLNVF